MFSRDQDTSRAIECGVCWNSFDASARKPKILAACGHSVCKTCTADIISKTNMSILCPICRGVSRVSSTNVDDLPTNFTVLSMIASLCAECKNNMWTVVCEQCSMKICISCKENHSRDIYNEISSNLNELRLRVTQLDELESSAKSISESVTTFVETTTQRINSDHAKLSSDISDEISQTSTALKDEIVNMKHNVYSSVHDDEVYQHEHDIERSHRVSWNYHYFFSKFLSTFLDNKRKKVTSATSISASPEANNNVIVKPFDIELADEKMRIYETINLNDITSDVDIKVGSLADSAVNREGTIYVSDVLRHCVYVLERYYTWGKYIVVSVIGQTGTARGQFSSPGGLALDKDGKLYVCDSGNKRIQILSPEGICTRVIRCGPQVYPHRVTVSRNGKILVCDSRGDLHLYLGNGRRLWTVIADTHPHRLYAKAVAVDKNDNFVVANSRACVSVIGEDSHVICTIGDKNVYGDMRGYNRCCRISQPVGIAVKADNTIVVLHSSDHLYQFRLVSLLYTEAILLSVLILYLVLTIIITATRPMNGCAFIIISGLGYLSYRIAPEPE